MGLFRKRKTREEKAAEIAAQLSSGKGFYGRTTRAVLRTEDYERMRRTIGAHTDGTDARELVSAGVPTFPATVLTVADTGQLVNFDPVVDLTLQPEAGGPVELRTLVSKIQVPRPGDRVLLISDPRTPGAYLYAGPATA